MSAVDFSALELLPKMFEKMISMESEIAELKEAAIPKLDLTKRAGVRAFLDISDSTINTMMNDGRLKIGIHFTKELKGKRTIITFVDSKIRELKEKQ